MDLKKQAKFYSAHIHTHSQDHTCISIARKTHRTLREFTSTEGTWLLGNRYEKAYFSLNSPINSYFLNKTVIVKTI